MKKLKFIIVAMSALLLLVSASSIVLAIQPANRDVQIQGQGKAERLLIKVEERNQERVRRKSFLLTGKLLYISDSLLSLKAEKASKWAANLLGQEVTFTYGEKTRVVGMQTLRRIDYLIPDNTKVFVSGSFVYDSSGNQIGIEPRTVIIKFPKIAVINGQIESTGDNIINVKVKSSTNSAKNFRGAAVEVMLFERTKITFPSTLGTSLQPGLYVNVIGFIKDGKILALRVVVKGKRQTLETTGTASPDTTKTPGTTTETVQTTDTGQNSDSTEITTATNQSTRNNEIGSKGLIVEIAKFIARIVESVLSLFR